MTFVIYNFCMNKNDDLSIAEQELMNVLWETPKISTSEILKGLNARRDKPVTRSTVQVMVRRLIQKGWVLSEEVKRGNLYYPSEQKNEVRKGILQSLKDRLFSGSRLEMMSCMFDDNLTEEELQKLKSLISEKES